MSMKGHTFVVTSDALNFVVNTVLYFITAVFTTKFNASDVKRVVSEL